MSDRVRREDKVGRDALIFDDVLLVPACSAVHPRDITITGEAPNYGEPERR
jgi:IMP dehydrogenase/GMP reductase